jgi:hypothetical protein
METGFVLLGAAAVSLFGFLWIGAPIILTARFRNRRQEVISRQIALTEALDGALGMIVAPVVKKPLWGPWQIHIAVPLAPPPMVGTILAITHEALSAGDPLAHGEYQIVLTPKRDPIRIGRESFPIQFAGRCPGDAIAA